MVETPTLAQLSVVLQIELRTANSPLTEKVTLWLRTTELTAFTEDLLALTRFCGTSPLNQMVP